MIARKRRREILAAGQEREAAREVWRADVGKEAPQSSWETPYTREDRGFAEIFRELRNQLEVRVKDGDKSGFYKNLKGVEIAGEKQRSSQYTKDADGSLLRDMGLISRSVETVVQLYAQN